jgi:hypothetical protein
LFLGEFTVGWIAHCDISSIAVNSVTHVHQAHSLLWQGIVIGVVVQGSIVWSTSTDVVIWQDLAVVFLKAVRSEL